MSTGELGEKEGAKLEIIRILDTEVQLPQPQDTEEVIKPQECHKALCERFEKAQQKAKNLHNRLCKETGTTGPISETIPGIDDALWNVRRYVPGLKRKEETLTGKPARIYTKTLNTAYENIEAIEELVTLASKKTLLGKAQIALDRLEEEVKPLATLKENIRLELENLKVPKQTQKPYSVKEMKIDKSTIEFLSTTSGKNLAQSKEVEHQLKVKQYKLAEQAAPKYNELVEKLAAATTEWKKAEKLVEDKKIEINTLERQEEARVEQFDSKFVALRKVINVIIESGTYFGEDHQSLLARLSDIKDKAYKWEAYEDGVTELNTLQIDVNNVKQQVEEKVRLKAEAVSKELTDVKDPAGLEGDPVRKKLVDEARAVIAIKLKDAKLAKPVFAAQDEIPKFKDFVLGIAEQLEKRPEQTISAAKLKLVYGEPLYKVGGKSTGDGVIQYLELNKSKLDSTAVLDVPGRNILISAGPTTNYKPAEKEVTVAVEQDSPQILWKTPSPALKGAALSSKTLNAKLFDSLKNLVSEVLTYVPPNGTVFAAAGTQKLVAKYSGTTNRKAATDVSVDIKVIDNARDLGKEAALSGAALPDPTLATHKKIMEKWDSDDTEKGLKKLSQKVMNDIQDMTPDELISYMNKFIAKGGDGEGGEFVKQGTGENENQIWYLSNGLQVRYKPRGKVRPPNNERAPMFCVEAKVNNDPNEPSRKTVKEDVVFKLTSSGQPGPYGPAQTRLCDGVPDQMQDWRNKDFMDGACSATHLKCKTKVEQVITWANPPDLTEGQALGEASLNPTAEDKSALVFTNVKGEVITTSTILPAGAKQVLRVKGKQTLRYLASVNFVEVAINVKKVQKVEWNPTKVLVAGSKLGTEVLNAKVEDKAAVTYAYFDGTKEQPVDESFILPAGTGLELRARVAATELYHAVTEPVVAKIDVNKQPQEVTWTPLKTDLEVGSPLGAEVLNAVVKDNATVSYYYVNGTEDVAVDPSFVPPVSDQLTLKALVAATDLYQAVTEGIVVKIRVHKKPQDVTWKPLKTVLQEDEQLGAEVLNASSSSGEQVEYFKEDDQIFTTTVLPPGKHELRALAKETATYTAAPVATINIVVNQKEEMK